MSAARKTWEKPVFKQWQQAPNIIMLFESPAAAGTSATKTKGHDTLSAPAISRAAKVTRKRSPEPVSRRPDADETLRVVLACLDDMKAEDPTTIDLTGKSSIGDYMVVATGRSQRHVGAVADNLVKEIEKAGVPRVRVEGMRQADWVLIDAGDVIVHVFRPEVREFYNLEKMWAGGGGREPRGKTS
jgi:ribosome-associated protein